LIQNTIEQIYKLLQTWKNHEFRNRTIRWVISHTGFGLSFLERRCYYVKDRMGNFMAGVTGQIKLSDRVALTGISTILTQNKCCF
jgi:OOP family OmpA-OmpF porin